ncbi:MAG: branched-chain amino acid ABC transporter permease [Gemmatimonadaceae bacterium]
MRRRWRNTRLTTDYAHDTVLFRSRLARTGVLALALVYLTAPLLLGEYWATVLIYAGIASIAAIGLNLLTGFTGQVSLGHAVFYGIGAYTAAVTTERWGFPFPLWLITASAAGGIVGGLTGPFALRLRGNYLVIVSLGLLVLGQHVFENWTSVTGGLTGTSVNAPVAIGSFDVARASLGGLHLTRNQGYFYAVWAAVAVLGLAATNLTRTRPGRAFQAIRDRDLAAEVIGVSLVRYKVGAFVVSGAYAACAGAMYASYARYVSPLDFSLVLSIQFIAMIVVGGIGRVYGSILGALFLTLLPRAIESVSGLIPFVSASGTGGGLTVQSLNQAAFGVLIILFLLFEPLGLAEIWRRLTRYFKAWPFSY